MDQWLTLLPHKKNPLGPSMGSDHVLLLLALWFPSTDQQHELE